MKKKLAFFLAFVMLLSVMAGCSGSGGATITADAYGTGAKLNLPLKAELNEGDYMTYGGYQFQTGTSLNAMANMITKNNPGVTADEYTNAYGKCYLFSQDNAGGTDTWCLYQQDPANIRNFYIFCGTRRDFTTKDGMVEILLPLHLISDSFVRDNMGNRLSPDREYACGVKDSDANMQDLFFAFYQTSGQYTVDMTEQGFCTTSPQGLQLEFTFSQHDDSDWFTITDLTERIPEPSENVSVRWVPGDGRDAENIALTAQDAWQLSSVLVSAEYAVGATDIEYPYTFDFDGESYMARVLWKNDEWTGTAYHNGKTAVLSTRDATELAALLCVNLVLEYDTDTSAYDNAFVVTAACMTTSNDLNLRAEPNTSAKILKLVEKDSPMCVIGDNGEWAEILFGTQVGFMKLDYLELT